MSVSARLQRVEKADIRVMLARHSGMVDAGIAGLINGMPGVKFVGTVGSIGDPLPAIGKLRPQVIIARHAPDVDRDAICIVRQAASAFPEVRLILLANYHTDEIMLSAIRAGAHGYLFTEISETELEKAIRAVARGEEYIPSQFLPRLTREVRSPEKPNSPQDLLTPKQFSVFERWVKGATTEEVAKTLHMSHRTVESHKRAILDRLKIIKKELLGYALKHNLIRRE